MGKDQAKAGAPAALGLALGQPLGSGRALTLWAVAVATGIVRDADLAAAFTVLDVAAQSGGAASFDCSHDTPLVVVEMSGVSLAVSGTAARKMSATSSVGRMPVD